MGFDAAQTTRCKQEISDRNLVSLRAYAAQIDRMDAFDTLRAVTLSRGTDDVLAFARPLCRTSAGLAGIERLSTILAEASRRGYGDRIALDLSLLRDFAYYTGFVFEGFVTEIGFALVGGGRYDKLLDRFGYDASAVGWSLSVERLLIALERRERHAPAASPGARA
jgi:ATP phosphoribosyltransferase regulatory subunit